VSEECRRRGAPRERPVSTPQLTAAWALWGAPSDPLCVRREPGKGLVQLELANCPYPLPLPTVLILRPCPLLLSCALCPGQAVKGLPRRERAEEGSPGLPFGPLALPRPLLPRVPGPGSEQRQGGRGARRGTERYSPVPKFLCFCTVPSLCSIPTPHTLSTCICLGVTVSCMKQLQTSRPILPCPLT